MKTRLKIFFVSALVIPIVLSFPAGFSKLNSNGNPAFAAKSEVKSKSKVIVYYFYGKPRCVSCRKIETYTKEAVNSLNNPNVEFKAVDLDQAENKHYSTDYKLYTKSVVLSKVKNGKEIKSKNLTKIWTKLRDEKAFKTYVTKEIKSF